MTVKCFFLERTDEVKVYLRRYHSSSDDQEKCKGLYGYHNAHNLIGTEEAKFETRSAGTTIYTVRVDNGDQFAEQYPYDHPAWPKFCDYCGYKFTNEDEFQIFTDLQFRRVDTGELMGLHGLPEGAMYYGWWENTNPRYAPTGPLYAITPGRNPWNIDGRASNCGMPDDDVHRCWIRHGEPPNITVDKNGNTCAAGGGSIQAGNYHGFLQNGEFT